ncbi:oligosaccharide flippase family protein [Clostridiaceae bacterium DONG20-135]|uniref:Oligosaccharide flippase family protein n=1 Tax=Copranaerobaculum intestinale TaxID=2692629 RepID=A0A6N8U3H5_9FIRM|nr:oligosaccharide flippase family protein [Copranaerobaculum intestinale]MXQ72778.1 oligosaccharide flippase family protein [Copranaerobaculum intestinale]
MRKKYTIYNLISSLGGQMISLLIGIVARAYFVRYLGIEMSGLNSLCTTIISSLSIAELGIGDAITFNLYKPLAENNRHRIIALMGYFKKIYVVIAFVVLVLGGIMIPFLPYFTNNLDYILVLGVFLIFLINSFISYFFSYKRVMLFSNQKDYLISSIHYMFYFAQNILQIIVLVLTSNIYLFLLLMVLATLGENFLISYIVDKKYKYLRNKKVLLDKRSKKELFRDVKSTLMFKLGRLITENEDNLIISFFIGVSNVGIYANYLLIMTSLRSILLKIFKSCLASLGNLNAEKDDDYNYVITNVLAFINLIISGFVFVEFSLLINRFIPLWVGKKYLFTDKIVILLGFIIFLQCSRAIFSTFRDGFGLFRVFNWRTLAEAFVNFVLSVFLVKKIGIYGIFLGTAISNVLFFIIEPIMVYSYKFHKPVRHYLLLFIKILGVSVFCIIIMGRLSSSLYINWISLLILGFSTMIVYLIIVYLMLRKDKSFIFLRNIGMDYFQKIKNR